MVCLVPRPLSVFHLSQSVSGHVVHSPRIRHRNELTMRAWEKAVRVRVIIIMEGWVTIWRVSLQRDTMGVFHLTKDSGKFWEFQWEMFICEKRVPFDTRSIHSQAPFSVRSIPHQKIQNGKKLLWLNKIVELSLEEESLVN